MKLEGKVVIVTGAANGIGRALARAFRNERAVVIAADLDPAVTNTGATDTGEPGVQADVSKESDVVQLVNAVTQKHGRVDVFCSNAGIMVEGGPEVPDADWQRI